MAVSAKEDCPCGSGKKYGLCHGPIERLKRYSALWGLVGIAIGVAGTLAVQALSGAGTSRLGATQAGGLAGAPADVSAPGSPQAGAFGTVRPGAAGTAPIPIPTSGAGGQPMPQTSGSQPVAPGENPTPWQYDVARNRYYDPTPGHQHWHNGPPPANPGATPSQSVPQVTATTANGQAVQVTTPGAPQTTQSNALKPGENPVPWQYDAGQNRYYDPRAGHQHWHPGQPPAPDQRK